MEMKTSTGKVFLIDEQDFEKVNTLKWVVKPIDKSHQTCYVVNRTRDANGVLKSLRLHRFITEAAPGVLIDHINGNGLDNRRSNLRVADESQNRWNTGPSKRNTSGVKGVSVTKSGTFWAQIRVRGKRIDLGKYPTLEAAAAVRLEAEKLYFGDYARAPLLP